jgi:translation initiation factor 1
MSGKDKPFHNPFEALRGRAGPSPAAADVDAARPPAPAPPESPKLIPRAVVRVERSGRGGKVVTVVEHLEITAAARDEWLKALKTALGCGGSVEDGRLVFQGDQRTRLPALIKARGVRKVTLG